MSDTTTNNTEDDSTPQEDAALSTGNGALTEDEDFQNIDLVMDIPVTLSMELGRTRISIRELLKLKSGSVVELPKMADEPMDVLVNGTLVARGEAVVVEEKFGIRLTDVVSPMERVKNLK
jgi:flagellar motor switch protein FliN/FliY